MCFLIPFFSPKSSLLTCMLSCYHHIIEHPEMHFLTQYKQRCYARISVLRKALTTNVNKYHNFFHLCLVSPISCCHVTRLLHHSARLMNELRSLHHSQSINNYLVYMIKKMIHGYFQLWNFSSRVQLDTSLVSYRVKHSKRNFISSRAHVFFAT